MERDEIKNRVNKVIAQVLKTDEGQIEEEQSFAGDLGAESVQAVELMAGFEEEFDIEMMEDEALGVKSVGDAVKHIKSIVEKGDG